MWGGGGGWRVLCALAVATLLQCVAATVVPNSMCIAVLSYNRMELLEITLDAVAAHLRADEPGLAWGVAWVDNGSSESNHPAMHQLRDKLQADTQHPLRTRWYKENQGLAAAFNMLYFNLCADYEFVLTLEEDWWYNRLPGSGQLDYDTMLKLLPADTEERSMFDKPELQFKPTQNAARALASSIALLHATPSLLGVSLRGETKLNKYPRWQTATLTLPQPAAGSEEACAAAGWETKVQLPWRSRCMDRENDHYWGSYSNGGCLYSLERLAKVGRFFGHVNNTPAPTVEEVSLENFPDVVSEANYAYRAGMRYCLAEVNLDHGCPGPGVCNHVLTHIGGGARSTKEQDASATYNKNKQYDFLRRNYAVRFSYMIMGATDPMRDVEPLKPTDEVFQHKPYHRKDLSPDPLVVARDRAHDELLAHESMLNERYLPMRHTLEDGLARVLDALESQCVGPSSPAAAAAAAGNHDNGSIAPLPPPLVAALADAQQRLGLHYANMSFTKPSMPSTWHLMRFLATIMAQRQGLRGDATNVPVRMSDSHIHVQRLAAELPRMLFMADTLAACPAPARPGALFVHFLKPEDVDADNVGYRNSVMRLVAWVRELPTKTQANGLGEGTVVALIHRGLQPEALKVISELRPELRLLPILDLGPAASQMADPVWLRYQTTLAAMKIMRDEFPELQTFAMVKFEELYVARDPLTLTALLDSTFDLFVSPHIEPAMYLTHTMTEKCFPPPVVVATSGQGYSTAFVGGPAHHMQSLLEQVLAMAPKMLSHGGVCEEMVLSALLWDHAIARGELTKEQLFMATDNTRSPALPARPTSPWRIFSAAPLTAGLRWWNMTASDGPDARDTHAFYLRYWPS